MELQLKFLPSRHFIVCADDETLNFLSQNSYFLLGFFIFSPFPIKSNQIIFIALIATFFKNIIIVPEHSATNCLNNTFLRALRKKKREVTEVRLRGSGSE